jgi:hypothetical protein
MRYLIRYFEHHKGDKNLHWVEKELTINDMAGYNPSQLPTALDFYIAAFNEWPAHNEYSEQQPAFFTPWVHLKSIYLVGDSSCVEFTLNQQETGGASACTKLVKSYSAPISPPKMKR